MLRLDRVAHRFGHQQALDDVSLHVRRGDCYGFIGHNGAGKTTALRVALGLIVPDRGRVLVDGFDAARHPREARIRCGALIETPGFHGAWSARANLELMARASGLERRAARAAAGRELERVGLADAAQKKVGAYSQGMRQRLGIALSLLCAPRLLLLDEPTNGLDPEGIADVRTLLARLVREEGLTVIVSSHHLDELSGLVNRVGLLRAGRLVLEQETARLLGATGDVVRVEVLAPERARAALASLGLAAQAAPDGSATVELQGGRTRDELARALVAHDAGLVALGSARPTLEAIYLAHGTASGAPAAAPAAVAARADGAQVAVEPAERRVPGRRGARAALFAVGRVARHELTRWARTPGVVLLAFVPALAALAALVRRAAQARADAGEVADAELFSATAVSAFEGVGVALQAALPLCAFALLGLGTQSFAGEAARGTLRNLLWRPLTRADVVLGKALALGAATLGAYALAALAALAAAAIALDFTGVVEVLPNGSTFPLVAAEELWPELRRALAIPLLPLCAYAWLGLVVGARARSGAGALAAGLALGVGLDLARAPLRAFGREGLSLAAALPSPLGDRSFVAYFVDVARGIGNARLEPGAIDARVPLVYLAAALALALALLARREVP